jgi:hypothetical protein
MTPDAGKPPVRGVFISHASEDAKLAGRLAHLISIALPGATILCTSVDGYRLPAGSNVDDQLRKEVHDSMAFIGIVSRASLRSMYVLFELGARWGAGKSLIPLVAHGVPTSMVGAPLSALNALRADSTGQLQQLVSDLAIQLGITPQNPAVFDRALQDVAHLQPGHAPQPETVPDVSVMPPPATRELKVRLHSTTIDEPTGVSVTLLSVSSSRLVALKITMPGKETELLNDATAGWMREFGAEGKRYRLMLMTVDYIHDLATLEIRAIK